MAKTKEKQALGKVAGKAAPGAGDAGEEAADDLARPLSPDFLASLGALPTSVPVDAFDPAGAWKQCYRIWMTGGPWQNYRGLLTLERAPAKAGTFMLTVTQSLVMDRMRATHETAVECECRQDALATPVSWRLRSRIADMTKEDAYAETVVNQSGRAVEGAVEIDTNGHTARVAPAGAWTGSWMLFAAVQRLPRPDLAPLEFDLLDDLDLFKPGHRLICRGAESIRFGENTASVTRYDVIGPGGLPGRYYVDGSGRLLLAHSDLRAFILDSEGPALHAKSVQWLAKKEMK